MVFIIDLPRLGDAETGLANNFTAFGEELSYFLTAQGMDERLIKSLRKYDFSETAGYGFVHSM